MLHTFTGGDDGGNSYAGLTFDSSGNLYGTTYFGGTGLRGVLFKIDPAGQETVLHNFGGRNAGAGPISGVVFDTAGNLYGATYYEGDNGVLTFGCGLVYQWAPSGQVTILYSFPCYGEGAYPSIANLALDSAGNIYGTTYYGGLGITSSNPGYGIVYKLDPAGQETVLYRFTGKTDGANPNSGVILDAAGNLYGTTSEGGTGGEDGRGNGVVFELDTAGTETVLHTFTGQPDGANPDAGLIFDSAGNLYGTSISGGPANFGAAFRLEPAGTLTVFNAFAGAVGGTGPRGGLVTDASGNFYGVTDIGGQANLGVVYRLDASGTETVLHTFPSGQLGDYPLCGIIGYCTGPGLVRSAAADLYGVTSAGGAGGGVVFKLTAANQETVLYTVPAGLDLNQVTLDRAGDVYGAIGGFSGVVYKINTAGQRTVLHVFDGADGFDPSGNMIFDASGNLYGTTHTGGGGASEGGVVFKLDPSGNETVLYRFKGAADGEDPASGLAMDPDGNLYGATTLGGADGLGAVFKLSPNGSLAVLYTFTSGVRSENSYSNLVLDAEGNLYGTSTYGGIAGCQDGNGCGYAFKIDPSRNETTLYAFTGEADGGNPTGPLVFDSSGNLYGTALYGGAYNGGVIYELRAASPRP